MEFLELLMILISLIILIAKPQLEKLAFRILVCSWALMLVLYIGRRASEVLTTINL